MVIRICMFKTSLHWWHCWFVVNCHCGFFCDGVKVSSITLPHSSILVSIDSPQTEVWSGVETAMSTYEFSINQSCDWVIWCDTQYFPKQLHWWTSIRCRTLPCNSTTCIHSIHNLEAVSKLLDYVTSASKQDVSPAPSSAYAYNKMQLFSVRLQESTVQLNIPHVTLHVYVKLSKWIAYNTTMSILGWSSLGNSCWDVKVDRSLMVIFLQLAHFYNNKHRIKTRWLLSTNWGRNYFPHNL